MSIEETLLIIRKNDFLASLSDAEYEQLNVTHNFITADRNAYLYFDAQYLNKLYFIKEGYVKIGNIDDEGNELIKDILQPGDVFGQITLERNNLAGEFAQAYKAETILCAFSINDFEKLLLNKPELSIVFSKKIGQQLRRIDHRLINLLKRDARTRILYFFWTILPHNLAAVENSYTLDNYFTHEDIARLTGTSRQTVTTLISQFALDGLLEVDRKQILFRDIKLLQKEARVG